MVLEFGVVFPLVVVVITAIAWFGVAYTTQLSLDQAAREGVRVYALTGMDGSLTGAQRVTNTQNAVATALAGTRVQTYSVSCGAGSTSGSGCSPNACNPANPGATPPQAWVRVQHSFDVPFKRLWPIDAVALNSRAVLRCGG